MAAVPVLVPKPTARAARRPDPALGVFETLLVLDGRPLELDAHLARLRASLAELYPDLPPPSLDVPVERGPYGCRITGTSAKALRIAVAPGEDGRLEATIERRPATGHSATGNGGKVTSRAVSLRSLLLPGGLGEHKWADRSLLDEVQAELPSDALPLLVDKDGSVFEASRANVFAVRDGVLHTPPADGRILPGVTRMQVLELAGALSIETREAVLPCDDLLAADEIFLTGSVRGIEPAASLDGAPLRRSGEVTERLAAELRQAWSEPARIPI